MNADYELPEEVLCPVCQKALDAAKPMAKHLTSNPKPKPGDLLMCGYCLSVSIYNHEMKPGHVRDEIIELLKEGNPELYNSIAASRIALKNLHAKHPDLFKKPE